MAVTWTITNVKPAVVDVHPALLPIAKGAGAGTVSRSGVFRAMRCTAASAGTYVAAGDSDFDAKMAANGIGLVEAVLIVSDSGAAPAVAAAFPRYNTATSKMQFYVLTTGVELGAVAATGSFELLVLGRQG